ncbi:sugar ABC transporter permease [Burkholderia ubonensis]|nr:sugar ABC transporter permease [Burkholderia ubonensis]KVS48006.1 sugar ABC transporter permease [Burkholderia ubonensis]KVS78740.1 sugar ABC transporter permease [Burkholderia ubonensis]KVS93459.1 sugar ABC transporter permease [Burkholderia ubonensis]KVS94204.1 sugar ABC transporter permease [Burkholderia ubonensis]
MPEETGIAFVLLIVLIGGAFATPDFLTLSNINILLLNGAVVGFLCLGQTFVLLTGGIDLACGSITALTCVLAALLMSIGVDWRVAVGASLLIGILAGAVSGVLITVTGVPPFIVTFAMMGVAGAIPQIVTGAETIQVVQDGYKFIGQSYLLGMPFPVFALAVATLAAIFFLRRSVLGTHIYAVGGNAEAARLAGVNVKKVTILVYAISGFCGACGGLIYGSRLMNGYPTAGRGDELFFSIAGAVVGGVSLFGGKGSIVGAAIGATLVATISNLMNVLNVDSYWQPLVIGLIILAGVTFDTVRARKR